MRSTRAASGLFAAAAMPLLLTGCLAVRPDASPANSATPAHGQDGSRTPSPPAIRHVPPTGTAPTPLPTSHLDPPDASGVPDGSPADPGKPPEASSGVTEQAGANPRPKPRPGLAASGRHDRPGHHPPGRQPDNTSPGWPGAGPGACSAASAIGIFAPGSSAEHACQSLAQHERPYLHGHGR